MRQNHTDNERKLLSRINDAEKEKVEALHLCEEMQRRLDDSTDRFRSQERSSESKLASALEQISKLQYELQQQQLISDSQIKALTDERHMSIQKLQSLGDENSRLSAELSGKCAAVVRLEDLNSEMQEKLSLTLNKLHGIMLDDSDSKESMLRLQREKAELASREQELVARLTMMDSSRHADHSVHNELKAVIARLEQEVIDVKRDRDSVFSELANSRQTISSLEMMCSTVRSESERIRTSLMEHVEQLDSRVKTLAEERDKLLASDREMKRKFEQSNELVMCVLQNLKVSFILLIP
jgi:chromosome segregation ATPase